MALTKLDKNLLGFSDDTDFVKLPSGTTGQRPGSPAAGQFRFNTTIGDAEVYDGNNWQRMGTAPPTFSSLDYPGDDTALDPAGGGSLIITGSTFNEGVTVTIGGTTPSSITRNSATQLTVTAPAKSAGTYALVITNTDGGTSTSANAVSYNGIPAFSNAAGSLGSVEEGSTVSLSAAATEPDGGAVNHVITSGSLPSGLSINASTGAITGTAPSVSADTVSNFTVTATDNENQSTARAYSITVTNIAPSQHFSIKTYTGNGGTQAITGIGFKPDLVWVKKRSGSDDNAWFDSTRGIQKEILSNSNAAEATKSAAISSFDADGFTTGANGALNGNGATYVAWCFRANGGTTSSNSDGDITSTVQANDTLGFSIAKWTSTSSSSHTIGHGLSGKPDAVLYKKLSSTGSWFLYTDVIDGSWDELTLNATGGKVDYSATYATSTTFRTVTSSAGADWITYSFKSVAGFSKIGKYTGNGNAYGPIVETGFEPAFIMFKRTDGTSGWNITDNKRDTSNPRTKILQAHNTDQEYTSSSYAVNFLTNGFQIVNSDNGWNTNNATYMYMAFAEDPNTTTPTKANTFKAKTFTGNGGTQSITGLGFKPDLVWMKNRTDTVGHRLYDTLRGDSFYLESDTTAVETGAGTAGLTSFDSDGFSVGSGNAHNGNSDNIVAWCWKAGGIPTYNTSGDLNAFVTANQNGGFSVVRWKGNENANQTLPHGLGAAPELAIIKQLDGTRAWTIPLLHSYYSTGNVLEFDTDGLSDDNNKWSAVSSDYLTVGASPFTNSSGSPMSAYFFRSITGFSKIGYYNGTGTSSRSFTGLGFQPDFVMIKCTSPVSTRWHVYDSTRGVKKRLLWDSNGAEYNEASGGSAGLNSFDSDGWSIGNDTDLNGSGRTFLYMAFKHLT